jgi:hypothetical protein
MWSVCATTALRTFGARGSRERLTYHQRDAPARTQSVLAPLPFTKHRPRHRNDHHEPDRHGHDPACVHHPHNAARMLAVEPHAHGCHDEASTPLHPQPTARLAGRCAGRGTVPDRLRASARRIPAQWELPRVGSNLLRLLRSRDPVPLPQCLGLVGAGERVERVHKKAPPKRGQV